MAASVPWWRLSCHWRCSDPTGHKSASIPLMRVHQQSSPPQGGAH